MKVRIRIYTFRRFRFLWLKSIHGFRSEVHCAKCLLGEYHQGLNPGGMKDGDMVELEIDLDSAPVHYLCGVTSQWENNLHIPLAADPAAKPFKIERWGICVEFPDGGVRALPIIDPIEGIDPAFGTCRNWLFGLGYFEPSKVKAFRNAAMASADLP